MRRFPCFSDAPGAGRGWRRVGIEEVSVPTRWDRAPEPFEETEDVVPGETILRDLAVGTQTAGSATRILARFAAVRLLSVALDRPRPLKGLSRERRLAAQYTDLLRAPPGEAKALRAIVALARYSPPRRIAEFLNDAGRAAHRSRHLWGAFAVYREAYRLAVARGWHAEAAAAARGVAGVADEAGARHSVRLWQRRARVLQRRAGAA
jgi:hypothetical protein